MSDKVSPSSVCMCVCVLYFFSSFFWLYELITTSVLRHINHLDHSIWNWYFMWLPNWKHHFRLKSNWIIFFFIPSKYRNIAPKENPIKGNHCRLNKKKLINTITYAIGLIGPYPIQNDLYSSRLNQSQMIKNEKKKKTNKKSFHFFFFEQIAFIQKGKKNNSVSFMKNSISIWIQNVII